MTYVLWIGTAVTLLGVAGFLYCALIAFRARQRDPAAAEAALQTFLLWNMASVGVAAIGLMMVVLALILR